MDFEETGKVELESHGKIRVRDPEGNEYVNNDIGAQFISPEFEILDQFTVVEAKIQKQAVCEHQGCFETEEMWEIIGTRDYEDVKEFFEG